MEVTYHGVALVHVHIQILGISVVSIRNLESPIGTIAVGALRVRGAAVAIGIPRGQSEVLTIPWSSEELRVSRMSPPVSQPSVAAEVSCTAMGLA
jgi:hypothetical protein